MKVMWRVPDEASAATAERAVAPLPMINAWVGSWQPASSSASAMPLTSVLWAVQPSDPRTRVLAAPVSSAVAVTRWLRQGPPP